MITRPSAQEHICSQHGVAQKRPSKPQRAQAAKESHTFLRHHWHEVLGEEKVTQMVGGKMQLMTLSGCGIRHVHNTSIVDLHQTGLKQVWHTAFHRQRESAAGCVPGVASFGCPGRT